MRIINKERLSEFFTLKDKPIICSECNKKFDEVVAIINKKSSYDEYGSVWVCKGCIEKAFKMFVKKRKTGISEDE